MSDIVERLRRRVDHRIDMEASHTKTPEWEAADEITRLRADIAECHKQIARQDDDVVASREEAFALRARVAELEAALREIAGLGVVCASDMAVIALRNARAALTKGESND